MLWIWGAQELYSEVFDSIFSIVDKPMTLDEAMKNAEYLLQKSTERIMKVIKTNHK